MSRIQLTRAVSEVPAGPVDDESKPVTSVRLREPPVSNGMRALLSAVVWRYLAIGVQFVIVVLVARSLPLDEAGQYFVLFGLVTVGAILAGFGAPDGAVRYLPLFIEGGGSSEARLLAKGVLSIAAMVVFACGGLFFGIGVLAVGTSVTVVSAILWWGALSIVWSVAQLLAGLGRGGLGSFVGYSLTNFCYLAILVPFLVAVDEPSLGGVLLSVVVATSISALVAISILVVALRSESSPVSDPNPSVPTSFTLVRVGIPMMFSEIDAGLPRMDSCVAARNTEWTTGGRDVCCGRSYGCRRDGSYWCATICRSVADRTPLCAVGVLGDNACSRGSVRQSPQSCLYVPSCFCICTLTELLYQFSARSTRQPAQFSRY